MHSQPYLHNLHRNSTTKHHSINRIASLTNNWHKGVLICVFYHHKKQKKEFLIIILLIRTVSKNMTVFKLHRLERGFGSIFKVHSHAVGIDSLDIGAAVAACVEGRLKVVLVVDRLAVDLGDDESFNSGTLKGSLSELSNTYT